MVGHVDATGIVHGICVQVPAVQLVFDSGPLGQSQIAALANHLHAELSGVDADRIVARIAHFGVALIRGLDVGSDSPVPQQVERRPQYLSDQCLAVEYAGA